MCARPPPARQRECPPPGEGRVGRWWSAARFASSAVRRRDGTKACNRRRGQRCPLGAGTASTAGERECHGELRSISHDQSHWRPPGRCARCVGSTPRLGCRAGRSNGCSVCGSGNRIAAENGATGTRMRIRTVAGTHSFPTSSQPGRTRAPSRSTGRNIRANHHPRRAPLSSELRHCTAYRLPDDVGPGSHFGSTLNPGGAVLTLGVSRRRQISGLCPCRRLA